MEHRIIDRRLNLMRDKLLLRGGAPETALRRAMLIVLDLMLPGMSGSELYLKLRSAPRTRRTPIIMLTAAAAEADKIIALGTVDDDYIVKPFSAEELAALVHSVLRRADDKVVKSYLAPFGDSLRSHLKNKP